MVLAHSSYARAAGLQSEINKVTVTRVAGSEVEYKRQLNLYRKDMLLTVNEIKREQTKLRKSIRRYSKKIKQGRIERYKRERDSNELERRNMENMSRIAAIFLMSEPPVHVRKMHQRNEQDISPDSGLGEDDTKDEKLDDKQCPESSKDKEETSIGVKDEGPKLVHSSDENGHAGVHLPSIIEDEEGEVEEKNDEADENIMTQVQTEGTNDEQENNLGFHLPTLKPKKQVVSFADLIKLQHTTSTKKLFNLVNLLAKKHGIGAKVEEERESRNSSINRGSTEDSNASLRAASMVYPIKYGYSSQGSDVSLPLIDGVASDKDASDSSELSQEENSLRSGGKSGSLRTKSDLRTPSPRKTDDRTISPHSKEKTDIQTSRKLKKRNKSLPVLIDDFQRIKLQQMHKAMQHEEARRYSVVGTQGALGKQLTLPPLQKQSPETSVSRDRRGSISWAEAFGLLKGVHTLHDEEEF